MDIKRVSSLFPSFPFSSTEFLSLLLAALIWANAVVAALAGDLNARLCVCVMWSVAVSIIGTAPALIRDALSGARHNGSVSKVIESSPFTSFWSQRALSALSYLHTSPVCSLIHCESAQKIGWSAAHCPWRESQMESSLLLQNTQVRTCKTPPIHFTKKLMCIFFRNSASI
jgi:hypothetical protein